MTAELIQKLDQIVGKTFYYKGKNITIDKYKDISSCIVIFADGRPLNFLTHEIDTFLEALSDPIENSKKQMQFPVPKNDLIAFEPTKENTEIKSVLMETLQKVKEDPNYIIQASSICDVVGQMVAIQKNEIQMVSIISKYRQS